MRNCAYTHFSHVHESKLMRERQSSAGRAQPSISQQGLQLVRARRVPSQAPPCSLFSGTQDTTALHPPSLHNTRIHYFEIFTDDDDIGFEFASKDSELTEDEKIALLGKPKLGNSTRTQIRIKENKEYRVSDASSGRIKSHTTANHNNKNLATRHFFFYFRFLVKQKP